MAAISNNSSKPSYIDCITEEPLGQDGVYLMPCNHTTSLATAQKLYGQMVNGSCTKPTICLSGKMYKEWPCPCSSKVVAYYPQFKATGEFQQFVSPHGPNTSAASSSAASVASAVSTAANAAVASASAASAPAILPAPPAQQPPAEQGAPMPKKLPTCTEFFREDPKPTINKNEYIQFKRSPNTTSLFTKIIIGRSRQGLAISLSPKSGSEKEAVEILESNGIKMLTPSQPAKDKATQIKLLELLFANKEFNQIDEEKIKHYINILWNEKVFK